jgi:MFS family permease
MRRSTETPSGHERAKPSAVGFLYSAMFANYLCFGGFLAGVQLLATGPMGLDERAVGYAAGGYAITALLIRPTMGQLIDRHGRRPYLLGAFGVLALSSVALIGASTVYHLVIIRSVQGAASSTFHSAASAVATDLSPSGRLGTSVSRLSVFLYLGLGLGPLMIERFIASHGFTAAWLATAGLAVLGALFIWSSEETLPDEGDAPHVGFRLTHPAAVRPGMMIFAPSLGMAAIMGFSSLYAQTVGLAGGASLYMAFAVTIIVVRVFGGSVTDRWGPGRAAPPAMFACSLSMLLLASQAGIIVALSGAVLFAVGFGLLFPALLVSAIDGANPGERTEAIASFMAFSDVGMALGGLMAGFLAVAGGFGLAYGAPAAVCLVAGLALLWGQGRGASRIDVDEAKGQAE